MLLVFAKVLPGADIQAVLTGRVGPKAQNVLDAAGIGVYLTKGGTVGQVVEKFKARELSQAQGSPGSGEQGMDSPPRSRKEEIQALETEVAGLRQKLSQLLQRIEHTQEER